MKYFSKSPINTQQVLQRFWILHLLCLAPVFSPGLALGAANAGPFTKFAGIYKLLNNACPLLSTHHVGSTIKVEERPTELLIDSGIVLPIGHREYGDANEGYTTQDGSYNSDGSIFIENIFTQYASGSNLDFVRLDLVPTGIEVRQATSFGKFEVCELVKP